MSMNIFVVHALGADFSQVGNTRKTIVNHLFCFEKYAPQHRYYYHDVNDPATGALRDTRFHAVIFDTTALWMRWRRPRRKFFRTLERLSFIASWDAVKIAIPQDDYDHSQYLDDWLADYGFDVVLSSISGHQHVLYPRMSREGAVLPTHTGFVDEDDIATASRFAKPFAERDIDIGYRVVFLPARFGRHGRLKGLLASRIDRAATRRGFVTDISSDNNAVLLADDWKRFLGNSKFCPATESGSSILDPRGEIMDRTLAYEEENPGATFEEIEEACFPGEDGRWRFTAVSPRIFEAALLNCGQILVNGKYLEEMEPWRHYLPIDEKCEAVDDVFEKMRDAPAMEKMIGECRELIIETKKYRYQTHVEEVMGMISNLVSEKRVQGTPEAKFESLIAQHLTDLPSQRQARRSKFARVRWFFTKRRSWLSKKKTRSILGSA